MARGFGERGAEIAGWCGRSKALPKRVGEQMKEELG